MEYVLDMKELLRLKTIPQAYFTYWELMCQCHICADLSKLRGQGLRHKAWTEYLFQNLDDNDRND